MAQWREIGVAGLTTLDQWAAAAGDLDLGTSYKITNMATPSADSDAATKGYVDAAVEVRDQKGSVRVATVTAGTLASSFENGDTVDGVVLATGNRILIKDQGTGAENGIYTVNATGAPTRADDMAAASSAAGAAVWVEEGTANADSGWLCTNNVGSDVVGTDALVFTQFSGAGQITAGDGLDKTGNTLDLNLSDLSAVTTMVDADQLGVYIDGTGQRKITWANFKSEIEAEVSHDALQNFVGNEHIDHTSVSITVAGTANEVSSSAGAQDISTSRTWTIGLADNPIAPGNEGFTPPSGTTAQRDGTPPNGQIRYNTTLSEFEFYQGGWRNPAYDGGAFHDGFSDFVSNEHIDHSGVEIGTAAASGLSGGGDLTATRNIVVDIASQTSEATPAGTDIILIDQAAGGNRRKVAINDLPVGLHASTHKNGQSDELLLHELGEPTAAVNFDSQQLQNMVVHTVANAAARPTPTVGMLIRQTDTDRFYGYFTA